MIIKGGKDEMKKYIWEIDDDIDSFITKLQSVTESYSLSPMQYASIWDKEFFVLKQKSNNRFILFHHKPYIRNVLARNLYGKIEKTPSGIKITSVSRMALPVYVFLSLWVSMMIFLFVLSFLANSVGGIISTALMLIISILLIKVFDRKPTKIVSLVDDIIRNKMGKSI